MHGQRCCNDVWHVYGHWMRLGLAWGNVEAVSCFYLTRTFPYLHHSLFVGAGQAAISRFYFLFWTFQCIVQTGKMQSNICIWHERACCVGCSPDGNKGTARFACKRGSEHLFLSCQLDQELSTHSFHLLVSCLGYQAKPLQDDLPQRCVLCILFHWVCLVCYPTAMAYSR